MKKIFFGLFMVTLILTLAFNVTAKEVTIAVVGPLSGDYAIIGEYFVEGTRLAVDEINSQGGVNGITFNIKTFDDRINPTEATSIARRIATDDDVIAVIGHYSSSTVFAAQGIYDSAKIVHFTPSASHPDLTKSGKYTFRLWSTLSGYQSKTAEYSVNELGYKKQALIYVNNDWGKGSFDVWKEAVEENGGELVLVEQVLDGDRDFKSQLSKVASADADCLVILTYYTEGALMVSQARSMGIDLPIVGSGTFLEKQFLDIAGAAAEGIIFNTEFHRDRPTEAVQDFVKLFEQKYPGKEIGIYHPTAYEGATLIIEAIKNVGADREKIREFLVNMDEFDGVTGTYKFGEERDPDKENIYVIIRDGKFELFEN